jgi:hypothetical protein
LKQYKPTNLLRKYFLCIWCLMFTKHISVFSRILRVISSAEMEELILAWKRGLVVNKRTAHAQRRAAPEYWLLSVTHSWASSGNRGWAREPRVDAHFCKNVYTSTLYNLNSPPSVFAHQFVHYVGTSAITCSYSYLSVAVVWLFLLDVSTNMCVKSSFTWYLAFSLILASVNVRCRFASTTPCVFDACVSTVSAVPVLICV